MKNIFPKLITALSFAGMLVTAYLIHQHFAPVGTSVCNYNDYVSCDIVNKSEYSEILGVPVAIPGFLTYVALFVFGIGLMKGKTLATAHVKKVFALTVLATLFSAYLTYVEFFVLFAVCIFCLTQQLIILLITLLTGLHIWKSKK